MNLPHSVVISDPRVDESSGLACSLKHPGIIYTVNDEDGPIFAIDATTGETVGTFSVADRKLRDPEALSIGPDATLWIADIGINRGKKKAFALHALPEPGPGEHGPLVADKYRIAYPDDERPDAEAFLVHPLTGDGYVMTREVAGRLYRIGKGHLDADRKNMLELVAAGLPAHVTDACFTVDARFALLRQQGRRDTVTVLDAGTWRQVGRFAVPKVQQPETIAIDPDGRHAWIGSEGKNSPLIRVSLPDQVAADS